MNGYTNSDLTQAIALTIFNLENPENYLYERSAILSYIYKEKVVLSEVIQHKLIEKSIKLLKLLDIAQPCNMCHLSLTQKKHS